MANDDVNKETPAQRRARLRAEGGTTNGDRGVEPTAAAPGGLSTSMGSADADPQATVDAVMAQYDEKGNPVVDAISLPPGVQVGESLDPLVNPKVGEQDLPVEKRVDGRDGQGGQRLDTMDGPQAAHWDNTLNVEEEIERNRGNPVNLAAREVRLGNENVFVSPRTQREIEAGQRVNEARRNVSDAVKSARDSRKAEQAERDEGAAAAEQRVKDFQESRSFPVIEGKTVTDEKTV